MIMKSYINLTIAVFISFISIANAQNTEQDIVLNALNDELQRSVKELKIDGFDAPYFMSCALTRSMNVYIDAVLGALVNSNVSPNNSANIDLRYGNYNLDNTNFTSKRRSYARGYIPLPQNKEYWPIRRYVWSTADAVYKDAIMTHGQKVQEIQQQNLTDIIPDFSQSPIVSFFPKYTNEDFNLKALEKLAKNLSLVFLKYPGLHASRVNITGFNSSTYFVNTEGSKAIFPTDNIVIRVSCSTIASDGEELSSGVQFCAKQTGKLPTEKQMIAAIEKAADELMLVSTAPVIDEDYAGPVLFEGDAVRDLIAMRLLSGSSSLVAKRTPVYSSDMKNTRIETNPFENRLNQRLFPADVSIKSYSRMKEYNGVSLVGAFDIDNEGVIPADELELVSQGRVVNLLNNRVPSQKIEKSNGFQRQKGNGSSMLAPGTLEVKFDEGLPLAEIKKKLIEKAKENGMEYAYIVRKMQQEQQPAPNPYEQNNQQKTSFAKLFALYRVDVETGKESPVRSAEIKSIGESLFRNIIGSNEELVSNAVLRIDQRSNIPVSYILPSAVLFDDLDISKTQRSVSNPLPVVDNPLR
jgi:hypothetical protein